jgi:cupin 2 domain-containing protein
MTYGVSCTGSSERLEGPAAMPTNLLADLPLDLPEELLTTLLKAPGVRMERIISRGHRSPDGFWYDQPDGEWVLVLKGAATLEFEDDTVELGPGDCIAIPAHKRHRVAWTTPDEPTVWLAVHYREAVPSPRAE